jgi:hypothetical protein
MADQPISYQVTDLSPIYYAGVVASPRAIRSDLPGESIAWLLADGHILPCPDPANPPLPVEVEAAEEAPAEPENTPETPSQAPEPPISDVSDAEKPSEGASE